jgi:hypothetical protein
MTFPVPPQSGHGFPSMSPAPLQVRQMFSAVWGAPGDAPLSRFSPGASVPGAFRSLGLLLISSLSRRANCLPEIPPNPSAHGNSVSGNLLEPSHGLLLIDALFRAGSLTSQQSIMPTFSSRADHPHHYGGRIRTHTGRLLTSGRQLGSIADRAAGFT